MTVVDDDTSRYAQCCRLNRRLIAFADLVNLRSMRHQAMAAAHRAVGTIVSQQGALREPKEAM